MWLVGGVSRFVIGAEGEVKERGKAFDQSREGKTKKDGNTNGSTNRTGSI